MQPLPSRNDPPFRKEIQDFIQATETLFSFARLKPALTRQECDIMAYYIVSLADARHPGPSVCSFGTS